jgi:hypothetical protein
VIRQFGLAFAFGLCVFGFGASSALAQNLPSDVQERIEKVHIMSEGGRLAAVETVPAVFLKLDSGDFLHRPSGFICPRTTASLGGFSAGVVTIFDSTSQGFDVGCGMLAREGVNMTVFVFKRDNVLADVLAQERQPAVERIPPAAGVPPSLPATAEALGVPTAIPFAAYTWNAADGTAHAIYIVKVGEWYVHARQDTPPAGVAAALAQAQRMLLAAQEITH